MIFIADIYFMFYRGRDFTLILHADFTDILPRSNVIERDFHGDFTDITHSDISRLIFPPHWHYHLSITLT